MNAIQSIECGIVFLMAEWSGGSKRGHNYLVQFLEQHPMAAGRLHILNVDHHPELYDMPEFAGKIHGWGEAAVIKNGKVVFVTMLGKDSSHIQEHCEELLKAYKDSLE